MAQFFDDLFKAFNEPAQAALPSQKLQDDLFRAFHTADGEMVSHLLQKGAKPTDDMLMVSVKLRYPCFVDLCLKNGVTPREEHLIHSLKKQDDVSARLMLEHGAPRTEKVKELIANSPSDKIKGLDTVGGSQPKPQITEPPYAAL